MTPDLFSGTVQTILTDGHPALARQAQQVEAFDQTLRTAIADLAATLRSFRHKAGFGRAISAPQIGLELRLVVLELGAGPIPLINPRITWRSDDTQWVWDDCLSVPGLLVRAERAKNISIQYVDLAGRLIEWPRLDPTMSELIQHEVDHLDGILMTSYQNGAADIAPLSRRAELAPILNPRLTPEGIQEAQSLVDPLFLNTPMFDCEPLSNLLGCQIWLKVETVNPIRCFKGRGASVYVRQHAESGLKQALGAASAGNWGQALAYSCRATEIDLIVFAATTANPLKVQRMRDLGAEVRLVGVDFDEAKAQARIYAQDQGLVLAEDGLDLLVTEGHGSLGPEIHSELDRRGGRADNILVPLGNGALLNGVACWSKAASPATQMIGVAASGAPAMYEAWHTNGSGRSRSNDETQSDLSGLGAGVVETIADGLAVRIPIPEAVSDMADIVDDVVLVDDPLIAEAVHLLAEHAGLIVEPAGAAGLAALMADGERFAGRSVVVIITGSNVSPALHTSYLGNDLRHRS